MNDDCASRTVYAIEGMTCAHCAQTVRTALGTLEGVTGVDVDVAAGAVTLTHQTPVAIADVVAAVDGAGYTVRQ